MIEQNRGNELIEEYTEYLEKLIDRGFDFNTWCEHQYGTRPNVKVEPHLSLSVSPAELSHK